MRTPRHRISISDFRYTPLIAALGAAFAGAPAIATATTVTVNDPRDSSNFAYGGSTTLRGAIEYFNDQDPITFAPNCTGSDVINVDFDYPTFMSNGPFVSQLSSELPAIFCDGLTINGVAGAHGKPAIAGDSTMFQGLWALTNTPVAVKGLDVSGFAKVPDPIDGGPFGMALRGNMDATDNDVHGNSWGIHTDRDRSVANNNVFSNATGIYVAYGGETITGNHVDGNTDTGIVFDHVSPSGGSATGNFIGTNAGNGTGMYVEGSNISISGNTFAGNNTALYFEGDPGSTASGNYIGTDSSGAALGANGTGIGFGSSFVSQHTRILGNTIAGNQNAAIDLSNFDDVEIGGNFVGTNSSGDSGLANGGGGILTACGTGLAVHDNIVAGNGNGFINSGIELRAVQSGGIASITTTVSSNKVGLKGDGITPLGANSYGILLMSGFCNDVLTPTTGIVVTDNRIGANANDGIAISDATDILISDSTNPNVIFGNAGYGVNIQSGNNIQITGNLIHHNATGETFSKNINLAMDGGVLGNDPGDVDTGTNNNGQNYPTIDSVVPDVANNRTVVSFTLNTIPGNYRVDLYANSSATSIPGGNLFVPGGTRTIAVPASGTVSDTFVVPGITTDYFSMLATSTPSGLFGETSEFSPVVGFVPAAAVTISPPSPVDFGSVSQGNNSPSQTITVASTGTLPYRLDSIADSVCYGGAICSSGAFTCASNCAPGNYSPNASCQITATFHPPTIGTFSTNIVLCGSGPPFQRNITLTGTGVAPAPITISPSAFDFGATLLGTRTPATSFIVFNPSASPVSISSLTVTPGFNLDSSDCGTTLAGQDRCHANISFLPPRPGAVNGTFSVVVIPATAPASKAAKSLTVSATAALSGTGTVQAIIDAPSVLDLGDFTAGAAPLTKTVTIRNTGNAVLTLGSATVSDPFTLANGCPQNLAPNESCTLTVGFAQSALGPYSGNLVITSNAIGGSRTIALTARTTAIAAPRLRVSPATIGFGDRLLGTAGAAQRVTITNDGSAAAVLSPPTVSLDFIVTTTCGLSLAPAQTCFADVTFRPVGFGPRSGQLLINSNAAGSPNRVDLGGRGCRPFSPLSGRLGSSFSCSP